VVTVVVSTYLESEDHVSLITLIAENRDSMYGLPYCR
jgi:hypothetical protein